MVAGKPVLINKARADYMRNWRAANREKNRAYMRAYMQKYKAAKKPEEKPRQPQTLALNQPAYEHRTT